MAVSKIKKIEILGLEEDKDDILSLLQKLGIVELINIRELPTGLIPQPTTSEINLLEIEEAISYLASFQAQAGLFQSMVQLKPVVYQQQLKEVVASFNYQGLLKELSQLRSHLKHLDQHKDRLIQERNLLLPWRQLQIPLDQAHYTETCGILLGVLRTADYTNLLENCEKGHINLFCETIHQDKTNTYLVILYLKEKFEELEAILKTHHFNFVVLGRHQGTVEDRLLEVNREVLVLDEQILEAKMKIRELSKERFNLAVFYDYASNMRRIRQADKNLIKQQFTFTLSGWVRFKEVALLEKELSRNFKEIAIFISPAKEDENVPVILENRRLIQPFEFITQIYGMPKYHELDPTPFLAPFFFLYFGFCISDVGYGFMLASLSFFILKKFRMGPQGLRFFRLFLFCGVSTMIVGALTGSWFGNLFDLLSETNKIFLPFKRFKDALIILDPIKEPTKLLGVALSFGIVQVWFGNIVAAIGNIKNKRYLDIFLDQVTMLTFLFGLTGLGLIFLKLLGPNRTVLFKYAALLGGAALIMTQGRSEKGFGAKLFYGIYNLYNSLSGYLSDILSYSRLWALGLVTGVMATTINLLSVQFSQIIPSIIPFIDKISFIKIAVSTIVLVIVFVFGHIVSFLMNLLGAFVHPVRLQFVEFFSKFFKSGGRLFRPFKVETRYINIG